MHSPPQITAHNVSLGSQGERLVRQAVHKLQTIFDRISTCRVTVEVPQRSSTGDPIAYNVRVDLTVPGDEIVVTRQSRPELETAIHEAFEAVERRLRDYVNRHHAPQEPPHNEAARGWVTRLFPVEGYGFLVTPDHREIYFHRNSVFRGAFDALEVGTPVRFAEELGEMGPQASTVVVSSRRLQHAKKPSY